MVDQENTATDERPVDECAPVHRPDGQAEACDNDNVILDLDSRHFFQTLRQEAERQAAGVLNAHWCRMYLKLAESADTLDAFLARAQEPAPALEKAPEVPLVERVARQCHEANRVYCKSLGDDSQPSWEEATPEQRESLRVGVDRIMSNPNTTPEESHFGWMKFKLDRGWKYGEVKDEDAKTHPCLVDYDQLPAEQRVKDDIFRAVVLSNLEFEKVTSEPSRA